MQVQNVENEIKRAVLSKTVSGLEESNIGQRMPQRPGYGTQGEKVLLWANYFEMVTNCDLLLFRYGIEIHPEGTARKPTGKKLKRIIELLLVDYLSAHRVNIATDYKSNIICRVELPLSMQPYRVVYRAEDEDQPAKNANTYQLRLENAGSLRISELIDYLTSTKVGAMFASKYEILQMLNIFLGHHLKSNPGVFSMGANKHFGLVPANSETISLGAGLKAIRGFFVSVRAATSRTLVNVQVKHAACYEIGPLGASISAYLAQNDRAMFKFGNLSEE
jgi:eukaryotic translation initiation factor 2C